MGIYVSIPTQVEAVQWTNDNLEEMQEFCGQRKADPFTAEAFNPIGTYLLKLKGMEEATGELYVQANRAHLPLVTGEWVIKDSEGFYPCKDVIFKAKYREVL